MELQTATKLDNVAHDLGYDSFEDFALKNLKREIQNKLDEYQTLVLKFEMKYGMTYNEFSKRVVDKADPVLKNFDLIEKEDDDFAWEDAIEMIEHYSSSMI